MTIPRPRPPQQPGRHQTFEPGVPAAPGGRAPAGWSLNPAEDPTDPNLVPPAASRDWDRPVYSGTANTVLLVALGLIGAALLGLVIATEAGLLN